MTYEEIAEELEISDKTVSRWMAKILKNKVENRRKRENNDRLKGMKIMKKA